MKFNWGHGILIFLILFLILSFTFIIFSLNQSEDLVSENSYEQGADYSNQIEINKRSFIYSDSISISNSNSVIDLNLCKTLANSEDTIFVHFYRPSDKKADMKFKFIMTEKISIPLIKLISGRYLVKLSWNKQGNLYNIEKEISIK